MKSCITGDPPKEKRKNKFEEKAKLKSESDQSSVRNHVRIGKRCKMRVKHELLLDLMVL